MKKTLSITLLMLIGATFVIGDFLDLTAPTTTLVSPATNSSFNGNVTFVFWTIDDQSDIANCSLWGNFSGMWSKNQTIYNVSWSVMVNMTVTGLNEGYYKWTISCTDTWDNSAYATTNSTIAIDKTSPTVPVLLNPGNYTNSVSVLFGWNASNDSASGLSYYIFEYSLSSSFTSAVTSTTNSTNISITSLEDGRTYFLRVKAVDVAGNEGNWSNTRNITVDRTAPFSLSNVTVTDTTTGGTVNVVWTVSNATDFQAYFIYYGNTTITNVSTATLGATVTSINTTTCNVTGLESGTRYYFAVVAADYIGNTNSNFACPSAVPTENGWSADKNIYAPNEGTGYNPINKTLTVFDSNSTTWYIWQEGETMYYRHFSSMGILLNDTTAITNKTLSKNVVADVDSDNNVHVVWVSNITRAWEVYYEKIAPTTYVTIDDKRLTSFNSVKGYPSVVVDVQSNVQIIWLDYRTGTPHLYYEKLDTNGDVLVSAKDVFTFQYNISSYPKIISNSKEYLHVVWFYNVSGTEKLQYLKLDLNGTALTSDVTIYTTSNSVQYTRPNFVIDRNDDLQIVWADNTTGAMEVYYERISNTGSVEIDKTLLSPNDWYSSTRPSIGKGLNNTLYITWADWRNGRRDIYYLILSLDGVVLQNDSRITTYSNPPSASFGEDVVSINIFVNTDNSVHLWWDIYWSYCTLLCHWDYGAYMRYTVAESDGLPPVIHSVSVSPSTVEYLSTMNFTANITDNVGVNMVTFVIDGVNYTDVHFVNGSYAMLNWTVNLNVGVHNLTVLATDYQGNAAMPISTTFTVVYTSGFTVSLISPNNTQVNGANLSFIYLPTELLGAINNCSLLVNVSGTWHQLAFSNSITNSVNNTFVTKLPRGNYTWTVQCALTNGTTTTAQALPFSATFNTRINEVFPNPPTGDVEWIEIYNGDQVTINLTGWRIATRSGNFTINGTLVDYFVLNNSVYSFDINATMDSITLRDTNGLLFSNLSFSANALNSSWTAIPQNYSVGINSTSSVTAFTNPTKGSANIDTEGVSRFNMTLASGWNLVSLCRQPV